MLRPLSKILALASLGCFISLSLALAAPVDQHLAQASEASLAVITGSYHAMTLSQEQAYLAKATATERTAYLREIGLSQHFAALSPVDRATVRRRRPYPRMSADALRFLWGEPYDIVRQTARDEHWYYLDVSCSWDTLSTHASHGTQVEVYLVEGHVLTWRKPWSDRLHTWNRADVSVTCHDSTSASR